MRVFEGEITRRRKALLGYDGIVTGHADIGMPLTVRDAIGVVSNQDVISRNTTPWRGAVNALQADPEADIQIELPDLMLPPLPPPPTGLRTVTVMKPIQRDPLPSMDDGDPNLVPVDDGESPSSAA
jgi:hypothetical protein